MFSNFLYCNLLLLYLAIRIHKDLVIKTAISQVVLCTNVHFHELGNLLKTRQYWFAFKSITIRYIQVL